VASVHSREENDFVAQLAYDSVGIYHDVWLGGRDLVEGEWVWEDATPFDYKNWARTRTGTRPTNKTELNCLLLNIGNGYWYDWYCDLVMVMGADYFYPMCKINHMQ